MNRIPEIDWNRVDALIKMALDEDLGDRGDTTTNSVIDDSLIVDAVFLAKEDCICLQGNTSSKKSQWMNNFFLHNNVFLRYNLF